MSVGGGIWAVGSPAMGLDSPAASLPLLRLFPALDSPLRVGCLGAASPPALVLPEGLVLRLLACLAPFTR